MSLENGEWRETVKAGSRNEVPVLEWNEMKQNETKWNEICRRAYAYLPTN